jgi:hypothetical protein
MKKGQPQSRPQVERHWLSALQMSSIGWEIRRMNGSQQHRYRGINPYWRSILSCRFAGEPRWP